MARLVLTLLSLTGQCVTLNCIKQNINFMYKPDGKVGNRVWCNGSLEALQYLKESGFCHRLPKNVNGGSIQTSIKRLMEDRRTTYCTFQTGMDICSGGSGGCPSNFVWNRDASLCYSIVSSGKKDFQTANTFCKRLHGGRLAVLNSYKKFDLIKSLLKTLGKRGCVWVGAERENGGIVWSDGSEIEKRFWGPGEPNNYKEKCMCLYYYFGYMMNDGTCSEENRFVCEVSL